MAISRDGRGGLFDNIFVERLWRSVKYEEVYLKDYGHMAAARSGLGWYFGFYNHERPHQGLGYQIPAEVYGISRPPRAAPWWGRQGTRPHGPAPASRMLRELRSPFPYGPGGNKGGLPPFPQPNRR
ncbi:MAG: transposase [Phycisphaerae bacterium]|nr:transposase [Phycisphaerae bacterium]